MAGKGETDKFVGCILSVKTKPGPLGEVKNIIGTVRDIDLERDEQVKAIILDEALSNGLILPDGYVLYSDQIADLTVIGRADEIEAGNNYREDSASPPPPSVPNQQLSSNYGGMSKNKSQPIGISQNRVHNNLMDNSSSSESDSRDESSPGDDDPSPKVLNVAKVHASQVSGGNVLLNSLSGSGVTDSSSSTGVFGHRQHHNKLQSSHKIAKPKPRKAQPGQIVYSTAGANTASSSSGSGSGTSANFGYPQNGRNKASKVPVGCLLGGGVTTTKTTEASETLMNSLSISYNKLNTNTSVTPGSDFPKENILTQTFGSLSLDVTSTSTVGSATFPTAPLNGASLFNTLASAAVSAGLGVGGGKDGGEMGMNFGQNSKASNIITNERKEQFDGKKLGVLSQFLTGGNPKNNNGAGVVGVKDGNAAALNGIKQSNNFNQFDRSPRVKGSSYAAKQQRQMAENGETFGMANSEMEEDFDFEGSNAQFAKLPVSSTKPVKTVKDPHFTCEDTTHLAERMVESVTVRGCSSVKRFLTDTGIAIPAIDLPTRSKILNLAHDVGLEHSRMIETMARAVVQASLPLLGDTYRLSPEREDDRPWVLVCAGPHWQGAVGIATARIMASLGVRTYVHSPKEEVSVCAVEEKLYSLTGEAFTRRLSDLGRLKFELVIMAMDDHMVRSLSLNLYSRWLKQASVVFVDPPLISSYRDPLEIACGGKGNSCSGSRVIVISPVLPLAYSNETNVKFYLVNLGIPQGIFLKNDVVYKSPFGDKLLIQIFGSKQSSQQTAAGGATASTETH